MQANSPPALCCSRNPAPSVPTFSQINPWHIITPYCLRIHFNIIIPLHQSIFCLFPSGFATGIFVSLIQSPVSLVFVRCINWINMAFQKPDLLPKRLAFLFKFRRWATPPPQKKEIVSVRPTASSKPYNVENFCVYLGLYYTNEIISLAACSEEVHLPYVKLLIALYSS